MSDYTIINGELYHYGVPGMKWGVRRYQNPDGSLTAEGQKRFAKGYGKNSAKVNYAFAKSYVDGNSTKYHKLQNKSDKSVNKLLQKTLTDEELDQFVETRKRSYDAFDKYHESEARYTNAVSKKLDADTVAKYEQEAKEAKEVYEKVKSEYQDLSVNAAKKLVGSYYNKKADNSLLSWDSRTIGEKVSLDIQNTNLEAIQDKRKKKKK